MDVDKPKDAKPKGGGDKKGDKKAKPEDPDAELSEEDLELKKNLDLMVERVGDSDPGDPCKDGTLRPVRRFGYV